MVIEVFRQFIKFASLAFFHNDTFSHGI